MAESKTARLIKGLETLTSKQYNFFLQLYPEIPTESRKLKHALALVDRANAKNEADLKAS